MGCGACVQSGRGCAGACMQRFQRRKEEEKPLVAAIPADFESAQAPAEGSAEKGKGKGDEGEAKPNVREIMKGKFQILLSGTWKDYGVEEDSTLKRAYLVGFPHAKFHLRGNEYEYDFQTWTQKNLRTKKDRQIRPPKGMTAPPKPVLPPGPMIVISVPAGSAQSVEIHDPNHS